MAVSGFNTPSWRPSTPTEVEFAGPSITKAFSGILFDMDGTLIDSTNAIVKHWERIGKMYDIDPRVILATSHGRRSIDVFQQIDPSRATWKYICEIEGEIPRRFGNDAVEIPGARSLLTSLEKSKAKWSIVTSGTRPLVEGWLRILGLAEPKRMVTAEDVRNGKPDPECYKLGRKRLGLVDNMPTLVLEDAPAGVRAGKAAGCQVLALATTHQTKDLREAGADWIVRDLSSVSLKGTDASSGELLIEIRNTLS